MGNWFSKRNDDEYDEFGNKTGDEYNNNKNAMLSPGDYAADRGGGL
jgi:hypothetical protein